MGAGEMGGMGGMMKQMGLNLDNPPDWATEAWAEGFQQLPRSGVGMMTAADMEMGMPSGRGMGGMGGSLGPGMGGQGHSQGGMSLAGITPATEEEVQAFLAQIACEDHAVQKFMSLDARMKTIVISKGHMTDARDQTAVLISRCANAQKTNPGDWICPGCGDCNFGKNSSCRKCHSSKP